jgi:hypothetical protein
MKALESAGLHANSQFSRTLFSPLYDIVGFVKALFFLHVGHTTPVVVGTGSRAPFFGVHLDP